MKLNEWLGIELPIIQAPMAGAQASAMTIAVSNAGGLGSLPCALLTADGLRKELELVKGQTGKPFNVNFFCHAPPVADAARESWQGALAGSFKEALPSQLLFQLFKGLLERSDSVSTSRISTM